MATLRQNLSPTANLLRNSRLFSLPNPLPRPNVADTNPAGPSKSSDSATIPYPTHQAIASTPRSRARGDWGLKRPLPSRSRLLQSRNPALRIKQLDSIEHITDFESAGDHVKTVHKFEEMAIPMAKGMGRLQDTGLTATHPKGAFERRADVTSYDSEEGLSEDGQYLEALRQSMHENIINQAKAKRAQAKDASAPPAAFTPLRPPPPDPESRTNRRWKHDGPWLPGMSANDFISFLNNEVNKRKAEFNQYLTEFVKNEIYTTRQLASRQEPMPEDLAEAEAVQERQKREWADISDADIDARIKELRRETADSPLTSRLVTKLILPFLRLPSITLKHTSYAQDARTRDIDQYRFDDETTPLSTHPSAGLGYLRTKSFTSNHPILGPQAQPTPVTARVVAPRNNGRYTQDYAQLGVGGFVARDEIRLSAAGRNSADAVQNIDIDTPGGAKLPVQPRFATVSHDGLVHLSVKRSTGGEVQVARGELEDLPPVRSSFEEGDPLRGLSSGAGRDMDAGSRAAGRLEQFLRGEKEGNSRRGMAEAGAGSGEKEGRW